MRAPLSPRRLGSLALLATIALAMAGRPAHASGATAAAPPDSSSRRVAWREWSPEVFDEARAENRLVLLNLTAGWCHWCRVMDDSSYANEYALAALRIHYIPVRVDSDLRPDIADRYLANGWPTTAALGPEGHPLAAVTYLPPTALRDFLSQAARFQKLNRTQVEQKVAEAERSVAHTWDPDTLVVSTLPEEEYVQRNLDALRDVEDAVHGGFGSSPKTARWDAISFLLRAADARRDDRLRALAVRSAAAALALQDSVDGGFFRAALAPDWSRPRFERLLDEQAGAIEGLARVYRATGERRFLDATERVAAFVSSPAMAEPPPTGRAAKRSAAGLRNAYMGPDAHQPDGSWIDGDVYFGLSRIARARVRAPAVSHYVLADATAHLISAETIRLRDAGADATRAESAWPAAALDALDREVGRPDGSVDHASDGGVRHGVGLLADQVAFGLACLDVYELTGEASRLDRAERIAAWLTERLEDHAGGGFRYAALDSSAVGRMKAGDKPEPTNAQAGTFFLRLFWLTGNDAYRRTAQRTADYLRSGPVLTLDPVRAELVLRLRTEPIRLLVVGGGEASRALRAAARRAPAPEVVVRSLSAPHAEFKGLSWPDGLPRGSRGSAVYRWTATGWRGPVTDPAMIGGLLDAPSPGE